MKLVKKILRLLPLLLFLYIAVLCIFSKNTNILSLSNNEIMNIFDLYYLGFGESINELMFKSAFPLGLSAWFLENFGNSSFLIIPLFVIWYELLLSLLFLCYDFINMVFDWANKFIKKGRNIDE